jgi:hypothetical protein
MRTSRTKTFKGKSLDQLDECGFTIAFVALLAFHFLLIWNLRLYPFVDLSDHLASATIIRDYGQATNRFAEYFSINSFWLRPNVFHLLFCSSTIFPSVEWANKVYYCLYVILLPISILLLVKKFNGDKWHALLAFTLLYNYNVSWGFVGYTMSIPLLFVLIYFIINYFEIPSASRAAVLMAMFVFLFFAHALMTVFALSLLLVCSIRRQGLTLKMLAMTLMIIGPVLIIIFVWWNLREVSPAAGPGVVLPLLDYYKYQYVSTFAGRFRLLILDNYFLYEGMPGCVVAFFFSLIIVAPAVVYLRELARTGGPSQFVTKERKVLLLKMLFWPVLCFALLPDQIFNFQVLYHRFSVIFLLAAIIVGSLGRSRKSRAIKIAAICTACVLHAILWTDYFKEFNRENASFARSFFPADASQKTLGGLIYDFKFRGKPVYVNFSSYYITWTQGVASFRIVDIIDFAPPIRKKDGQATLPAYIEWAGLLGSYDGSYAPLDYVLVRGEVTANSPRYPRPFNLEKAGGKWFLYSRKAP